MGLLYKIKQLEVIAERHWQSVRPSLTPEQRQRAKAIIECHLADPQQRDEMVRLLESARRARMQGSCS